MIEQISAFFTIEMIYLWLNLGVLPFWFILIFFPQSKICNFFVISIFPFVILGVIYIYLIYDFFVSGYNFLWNFNLYLGLDELRSLLTDTSFLIIFWLHFIAINLFCGSWIVNDSQKFMISKILKKINVLSSSMVFENTFTYPTIEGEQRKSPPPFSTYGFQKLSTEYFAKGALEQYGLPYSLHRCSFSLWVGSLFRIWVRHIVDAGVCLVFPYTNSSRFHCCSSPRK